MVGTTTVEDRAVEASPMRTARRDSALSGLGLAVLLCGGAVVGALAAAGAVNLVFPAAAVIVGLWLLSTRRWNAYLAFVLVLWLVAPEVRRVVDWQSTYHAFSVVSSAPALVSLLAFPWAVSARRRVHRDVAVLFLVAIVVMAYALVVGMLRNGIFSAAADGPLIIAPLVLGWFVLTVPEEEAVRRIIRNTVLWGAVAVGGYTIVQFLTLPPWDAEWMIDSGIGNLGDPVPREFRAFGPLGTSSYLAVSMVVMLLVLVAERRTILQWVGAGAALAALGLTLQRSGWLALVVGILVLALLGRGRVWRILVGALVAVLVLVALDSPIVDRVQERIEETRSENTQDTSLLARYWFQVSVAPEALKNVEGSGMGSTGRAGLVNGGGNMPNERFASFDSGIFESLVRYGSIPGGLLLLTMVGVTFSIALRSRRGSVFDACCAAALAALMVGMVFQDMQRGVFGVWLWLLFAAQGRVASAVTRTAGTSVRRPRADGSQQLSGGASSRS